MRDQGMGVTFSRILALVAAVFLISSSGCDDVDGVLAGSIHKQLSAPDSFTTAKVTGRLVVRFTADERVVELRDEGGRVYRIAGRLASALASVEDGDVVAWGTFDATPGFVVHEFKVTGMHGRAALDGVLEVTADGFGLRLADGSLHAVPGLSLRCAKYLGSRVWVTGWEEFEVVFGLIAGSQ